MTEYFSKLIDFLELAAKIISKYPLCSYCLGRQFASLGHVVGNQERGRAIKVMLLMLGHILGREGEERGVEILRALASTGFQPASKLLENIGSEPPQPKLCHVCEGHLDRKKFKELAERILEELKGYEFRNFVVGARIPAPVREREDAIRSEYGITTGEDIKGDITREIGRMLQKRLGVGVEYHNPEIVILTDLFSDDYLIQVNPLFIKGRYRKLARNLPQTPWYCRHCWGRGCERCGYTGREYPESISELIGGPALELFEALDYKFHGAGREDVDAAVAGTGRPFVLELKHPRKRKIDLRELEEKINREAAGKVEVSDLEYSSRKELRFLKSLSPIASKTYEAVVEFDEEVEEEALKILEKKFRDIVVEQRTPTRVLRRRADKLRKKKLYYLEAEKLGGKRVKFKIKSQGGLYVKELIDGDEGRTQPNIAETLGRKPTKIELTVIEIESPEETGKENTQNVY